MASTVALNYAEAIFLLGEEENKLELYLNQLKEINETLKDNNELLSVMLHPKVSQMDKKALLDKIFSDKDVAIINFLKVLIDKRRFKYTEEIVSEFINRYNEYNNIQIATVYSAKKLDEKELNGILEVLEKRTKAKIEIKNIVDKSLIAGIKVKINDEVIDNSIARKLERLKYQVKSSSIK